MDKRNIDKDIQFMAMLSKNEQYDSEANELNIKTNKLKKELVIYAGMLVLAFSATSMSANASNDSGLYTDYAITDDGNVDFESSFSYEKLIKLKLIKVTGINDKEKIYLVKKDWSFNDMVKTSFALSFVYTDVLTNKDVIRTSITNLKYKELGNISDYLVSMDMLKDKYNKDDINKLIEYVETCEEKEVEKVKEKTIQ